MKYPTTREGLRGTLHQTASHTSRGESRAPATSKELEAVVHHATVQPKPSDGKTVERHPGLVSTSAPATRWGGASPAERPDRRTAKSTSSHPRQRGCRKASRACARQRQRNQQQDEEQHPATPGPTSGIEAGCRHQNDQTVERWNTNPNGTEDEGAATAPTRPSDGGTEAQRQKQSPKLPRQQTTESNSDPSERP